MKGTKILSVVLSAVLASSVMAAFVGCAPKGEDPNVVWGTASEAEFNKEGAYSTTVSVQDAAFPADVSVDDVSVLYKIEDEEGYANAVQAADGNEEAVDLADYTETVTTQVKTVTRTNEHTLEVTFTDDKADVNRPTSYGVTVNRADGDKDKHILAPVTVNFPEYTLTSTVDSVSAYANPVRITLQLNDGEFASGVTEEDITLSGSFANLSVQSLSAAGKNLTMQLSGEIERSESSNAYLDGVIKVDKMAVEKNSKTLKARIPVDSESLRLDPQTLAVEGGNVKVDVVLGGYRFSDSAAASGFQIKEAGEEDGTLQDVYSVSAFALEEDGDNSRATLTIGGTDAKTKTDAAKALSGKTLEVGVSALTGATEAVSSVIDVAPADFYPVFDYAEVKNGAFNITVELYAQNGVFAETLNRNAVTFEKDFDGASVTSLTRTNDYTAELVFSVPTDKTAVEDMDLDGSITLAAGSLTSIFGEASEACEYSRIYDQASMGRFSADEIGQLKEIVGGFGNTPFGTVTSTLSAAGSIGSAIYTGLEFIGVIESSKKKEDKIYSYLNSMDKKLEEMLSGVKQINSTLAKDGVNSFFTNPYGTMIKYSQYCAQHLSDARKLYLDQKEFPTDITKDSDNAYVQKYLAATIKAINEHNLDNTGDFATLLDYYTQVCSNLSNPTGNAINDYDTYMTYYYNFEAQTYSDREEFRDTLRLALYTADILLGAYKYYSLDEKTRTDPKTAESAKGVYAAIDNNYKNAAKQIENQKVVRRTDRASLFESTGLGDSLTLNGKTNFYTVGETIAQAWHSVKKSMTSNLIEMSDEEIKDFNKRMKGATVGEELNGIGLGDTAGGGVSFNDGNIMKYAQQHNIDKFVFWDSYDYTCYVFADESKTSYGYCSLSAKTLSKSTSSASDTDFISCSNYPTISNCLVLWNW